MVSDMIYPYIGIAAGLLLGWLIEKRLNCFTFLTAVALVAGAAFFFFGGLFLAALSGHKPGYLPGVICSVVWLVIYWRAVSSPSVSSRHS